MPNNLTSVLQCRLQNLTAYCCKCSNPERTDYSLTHLSPVVAINTTQLSLSTKLVSSNMHTILSQIPQVTICSYSTEAMLRLPAVTEWQCVWVGASRYRWSETVGGNDHVNGWWAGRAGLETIRSAASPATAMKQAGRQAGSRLGSRLAGQHYTAHYQTAASRPANQTLLHTLSVLPLRHLLLA